MGIFLQRWGKMKHTSLLLVGAAAIVSGLLWVAAATPAGQDGKPSAWKAPRTPWGHPDLEGIWDSKTITPMERPAEATGREFLTDEEVAALERQAESRFSTAIENSAGITLGGDRADRGTTRDVAQAYSPVFISVGTRYVRTKRTSLVIDPPDGKIPYSAGDGPPRVRERDGVVRRLVHHQVPQNGRVQPHGLRSALRPALDAAEMGGPPRDH